MIGRRFMRSLGKTTLQVAGIGCVAHCLTQYVGGVCICSGPSMEPTIYSGDVILMEKSSVRNRKVNRGDIVIVKSPTNPKVKVCKRVAALEGDSIEYNMGFSTRYVPRSHLWLEGDNKANSSDSRSFGAVPYGLLQGVVFYKIWPRHDMGSMKEKT